MLPILPPIPAVTNDCGRLGARATTAFPAPTGSTFIEPPETPRIRLRVYIVLSLLNAFVHFESCHIGKAIQSISFYLNRGGKNLSDEQKSKVEHAKGILERKHAKAGGEHKKD